MASAEQSSTALTWVHHRSWTEAWREVRPALGGGQSSSKVVARIGDEASGTFFLKLLNRQRDPERRKRFFRETSALSTYSHTNIPRLVETNAFHYVENEFKLYFVSEFISGPTVTDQVSQRGTLAFDRALALTNQLAEIVGYCHGQGGIHRDIKPDNIILRDGRLDDPVLVDFGLSFNQAETIDFATEDSQELGNRFLRVPELSVGSEQRRDFRTDLTFVAAIFYYAYIGIPPAVLEDAEGRLPHQRPIATPRFAELAFPRAQRLRSFFDRAFQPVLAHRFTTMAEMRMALKELSEVKNGGSSRSADDILAELHRDKL